MIKLENLYYRDKENIILHEVTVDINKGDCISIVGESVSGKSTIQKICADLRKVRIK